MPMLLCKKQRHSRYSKIVKKRFSICDLKKKNMLNFFLSKVTSINTDQVIYTRTKFDFKFLS